MEMLRIVGIGVLIAALVLVLKKTHPELAMLLSLAGSIVLLVMVLPRVGGIIQALETVLAGFGLPNEYLLTVLRVVGIAYIAEFGVQMLRDTGEGALASKVELGGKALILSVAVPILATLLELIAGMMPG